MYVAVQAAGLLMLAFGVIALVRTETLVEIFDYFPQLTAHASKAGFDLPATAHDSAVFMIVLGGVVGGVGVLGCVGACYNVQWMLSVVSPSSPSYMTIMMFIRTQQTTNSLKQHAMRRGQQTDKHADRQINKYTSFLVYQIDTHTHTHTHTHTPV